MFRFKIKPQIKENVFREKLKFLSLGGIRDVTKNMYVYEYGSDILVVDCGIGFPDSDLLGVDVVIPDISYLEKNYQRVRAILVTHGHEDHFGALPYILPRLPVPVYATPLVAGFIKAKLEDYQLAGKFTVNTIDPEKGSFQIGGFKITPFRINHSVPDSIGYCLETPAGKAFHVPDFKFDWTPVDGRQFDITKVVSLAQENALLLCSDCLGANSEGYTKSEKDIEHVFEDIIEKAPGQVVVTTISSNISRIQQAINASLKFDRKIVVVGRSILNNVLVAKNLNYLKVANRDLIKAEKARDFPQNKLTYIVAGAYGQQGSALFRLASGTHKFVELKPGATVIFSADPNPPGVSEAVDTLVDKLTELGAEVHNYEIQNDLHVSGHGSQGDMLLLAALVKPKYFVPIGGTARHLRAYHKLISQTGVETGRVFELSSGQVLELSQAKAGLGEKIELTDVYVGEGGSADISDTVIQDKRRIADDGIVVVSVPLKRGQAKLSGRPEIASRAFSASHIPVEVLKIIDSQIEGTLAQMKEGALDRKQFRVQIERVISRAIFKKMNKRPLVLPIVVEV
ncbi:MAG: ribonuclease J [Patescibacteria group bacterium]|nr:ribonuclease J [Patescibacteria group bacterium]